MLINKPKALANKTNEIIKWRISIQEIRSRVSNAYADEIGLLVLYSTVKYYFNNYNYVKYIKLIEMNWTLLIDLGLCVGLQACLSCLSSISSINCFNCLNCNQMSLQIMRMSSSMSQLPQFHQFNQLLQLPQLQPNEPTNSINPTIVEQILPPNLLDQQQNDPIDQVLMNEIRIFDEMFRTIKM